MPPALYAVAVPLLPLVALLLWRSPVGFAALFVAGAAVADLLGIGTAGFQLGVTLYPTDVACAALLISCVVVAVRFRSVSSDLCWPALILLLLAVLNFARGVLLFGVKAPGNGARDLVNLILPAVAACGLGPAMRMTTERLTACLSWTAAALGALALARWAGVLPMLGDYSDDFRAVPRALTSDAAIIVGQALIAVVGIQLTRGVRITGLMFASVLAGLVFALQHRSVWIATAAGLVWLAFKSPRLPRTQWLKLSSLALLVGAGAAAVPLAAPSVYQGVMRVVHSNVQEIGQEDSTWAWRVQGYTEAVERALSESITAAVIGPPSGQDLSDKASFASIHIHDRYVSALAYYGIVGVLLLLGWLFAVAARIRRMTASAPFDHTARAAMVTLEALLVSALVFFVPYSGGQLEGAVLGLTWLAAAHSPAAARASQRWMATDRSLRNLSETAAS